MRWALLIVLVLVVLLVVSAVGLYIDGTIKLNHSYAFATPTLAIPTDKASIARGDHLAFAITKCSVCHGKGLSGQVFLDVPSLFRIVAPNLTRGSGGIGLAFSDGDYARAIRDGVAPDGRGLLVMPSADFAHLSDADLADIIAYVKSLPAVDNRLPDNDLRPLSRILLALGQVPMPDAASIDPSMTHAAAMPPAATVEYGNYLAHVGGCMGCHGAGLSGGPVPGVPPSFPPAQNITPTGIGKWSDADIVRALRVGKRPEGTTINPFMPWANTAAMTDTEMAALIKYLRSVPARPTGTH
ncbi:MAG TPA: cytochrome c [Candidatus Eremiobacteraceae bacterium]|nr:cytochrome c [Candidatus Eremiobacteraceae bacterium]